MAIHMSGVDISRIYANRYECPVCKSLLNNPLTTECGHNYCHQCIRDMIEFGHRECIVKECRKEFSRKWGNWSSNDDNVVLLLKNRSVYAFVKNHGLKEYINTFTIQCECRQIIELGQRSAHLRVCDHNICKKCGLRADKHRSIDCIDALKKDRKELEEELKKTSEELFELRNQVWKYQNQMAAEREVFKSEKYEEKSNKLFP